MNFIKILFLTLGLFAIKSCDYVQAASRIYGGDETNHARFPYQVRIIRSANRWWTVIGKCGGSILDDYHVLTAAHCVVDVNKPTPRWQIGSFVVVAGASDFKHEDPSQWVKANVEKIYIPKLYWDNLERKIRFAAGDVAVLKLDKSLNLAKNRHLKAVNLQTSGKSYESELTIVSGYGNNDFISKYDKFTGKTLKGYSDGKLRFAYTRVLSHSDCQRRWPDRIISESHICVQVDKRLSKKAKGVCAGDSGGPLVLKDNLLIGVDNAGPVSCVEDEQPEIYTRVSAFKTFINTAQNNINHKDILTTKPPIIDWGKFNFNELDQTP